MGTAFDIIRAFVDAHWATAPVRWPNEPFDKPNDAPWIHIEVEGGAFRQISTGNGSRVEELWREEGELVAEIMLPVGTGAAAGWQLGRAFGELFRGQDIGPLTFAGPSIGRGTAGEEDGAAFILPVSIIWTRDE